MSVCLYNLNDLHRYVKQYDIPLEEESILSTIGSIIRLYLYQTLEFKVNCRVGNDDRVCQCVTSLLPLNTSSSRKKKDKNDYSFTNFYVACNIRRGTATTNEPNAVLFNCPSYSKQFKLHKERERGIQLDFLVKKQLKYMVMGTVAKDKSKQKKRRGSVQPLKSLKQFPNLKLVSSQSKPTHRIAMRPCSARHSKLTIRKKSMTNVPNSVDSNLTIIYGQNNLLWAYFKNKTKIIDQNAWLPILGLWKQNESSVIYMLRGQKKFKKKSKKKKKRSRLPIIRCMSPTAPIPDLSKSEVMRSTKSVQRLGKRRKSCAPENEHKNPCKFYEIIINDTEVICRNLFDFPYLNIEHEMTWFDIQTQSLLIVLNRKNSVELQVIRHKNVQCGLVQSSTEYYRCKTKNRRLSASDLFHLKLENDTLKVRLSPPKKHLHWFKNCKCLRFFHHKSSDFFVLLLQKESEKMLLKLKINFVTRKIEHISYGKCMNEYKRSNIIGYDYNQSLLIMDTLYEPLRPLSTNILRNSGGNIKKMGISPPSNIYKQYNKWFSFASNKIIKKKYAVITKQFIAIPMNNFVCQWQFIYNSNSLRKN